MQYMPKFMQLKAGHSWKHNSALARSNLLYVEGTSHVQISCMLKEPRPFKSPVC